jgi:hypothetical protein
MDYEPHAVHTAQCHEDSSLRKAPRSECMHQDVVVLLPWWILVVKPRITVDPTLINRITGLSMQGPDPQDFYPGKSMDRALTQRIKDTYGDVEKGTRGYKVASIQSGAVHLACQLITGKLVRKNRPTQVTGFVVNLAGKCTEGLQMNWAKYLMNQLELDCREVQDQGYEFHFSWLLILITFIAWEMPEGATFPDIEPFEPLAQILSTGFGL